jgi:hypothetical protein
VYILLNTGGREIDYAAVETRKKEIQSRIGLEGRQRKDNIYVLEAFYLDQLQSKIDTTLKDAKARGFGLTVELSEWGHGGEDGPIGKFATSGEGRLSRDDPNQMKLSAWNAINFNFDPKHSIAVFYGCNELSFAKGFIAGQPNLEFAAGYHVSSYPSTQKDELDWHKLKQLDELMDRKMKEARENGMTWTVYFVGQTTWDRASGSDTTYLRIVNRAGEVQKAVPNADIDLLNRGIYQLLTREPDRP